MILIPRWLNLYAKKGGPSWQEKRKRRRNLLLFAGRKFCHLPEDIALITGLYGPEMFAPAGPNIQESVSAFPHGVSAAAGAGGGGSTLALTSLNSSNFDFTPPSESGVRFLRAGDVQEIISGTWSTQNTNTEWIAAAEETSTIGDDHQAKIDESLTTIMIFSSGWSENTYADINTTRTASIIAFGGAGEVTASGTAYVREKADTNNEVSASVFLSAEAGGGGILC